jgi:hypothetical protein
MNTLPHRLIIVAATFFLLISSLNIAGQTSANNSTPSTGSAQSTSEGIQKRDNEWGVWGGISFRRANINWQDTERALRPNRFALRSCAGRE